MTRRFYSGLPISESTVWIAGPEASHIVNVNRLRVNDELVLFDGSDREFDGRISAIDRNGVAVEIVHVREVSRELAIRLTLAVALPKGDRQKTLLEKLVELGVDCLIPLNCRRSVAIATAKSAEKLGRRVVEASKQCGRNRLMKIGPPVSLNELFADRGHYDLGLIAHPHGDFTRPIQHLLPATRGSRIAIAIGPEGGFADEEVAAALNTGWKPITLTATILRVETAALVAATLLGLANQNSPP